MNKWRTEKGELIPVSEMTDLHLKNAINYLKSGRGNIAWLPILDEERRHREEQIFLGEIESCPYCWGIMKRRQLEHDYSLGFGPLKYAFFCVNEGCGAIGPRHDKGLKPPVTPKEFRMDFSKFDIDNPSWSFWSGPK